MSTESDITIPIPWLHPLTPPPYPHPPTEEQSVHREDSGPWRICNEQFLTWLALYSLISSSITENRNLPCFAIIQPNEEERSANTSAHKNVTINQFENL